MLYLVPINTICYDWPEHNLFYGVHVSGLTSRIITEAPNYGHPAVAVCIGFATCGG